VRAYDQDIEEFVHLQYFAAETNVPCMLIAPSNSAARTRAEEVSTLLRNLRRPVVTLSDTPMIGEHLPHQAGVSELWHPMLHIAPLALLARESMTLRNGAAGSRRTRRLADAIGRNDHPGQRNPGLHYAAQLRIRSCRYLHAEHDGNRAFDIHRRTYARQSSRAESTKASRWCRCRTPPRAWASSHSPIPLGLIDVHGLRFAACVR